MAAAPNKRTTRQIWQITKQGALADLKLLDDPMPQLQPGEALVEVKAIGLNFADVFCCLGLYQAAPKGAFTPGLEFAGVVTDVHPDNPDDSSGGGQTPSISLRPGDRVMGVTRFGAFASHVALAAGYLRPIPDGWSFAQGAAFAVQALTAAYGLLVLGDLQAACKRRPGGATVLVQSAAGGVGLQAVAICRACGARVLGLVGSDGKVKTMRQILHHQPGGGGGVTLSPEITGSGSGSGGGSGGGSGDDEAAALGVGVVARVRGDAAVRAQLQGYLRARDLEGFDVFLDSAAGEYLQPGYDALAPCGRYVVFGAGTLTPPPGISLARDWRLLWPPNLLAALRLLLSWATRPRLDVLTMPGENKGALGFNLIWLYQRADLMADLFDQVQALHLPPPHVGLVEPWERLPAALEALQGGGTVGKVVVVVDGDG